MHCPATKSGTNQQRKSKKVVITYAKLCAMLSAYHIDLNWAQDQYWSTLFAVISEQQKLRQKPQKQKATASDMSRFVTKGG